jgi:hypothetical protein
MPSSYQLNFFEMDNKHPLSEERSLSLLLKRTSTRGENLGGNFPGGKKLALLQASELQQYLDVN